MNKLLSLILILVFANTANASGWTGKVKVTGVFVLNETSAIIRLSSFNNPDSCNVNKGHLPDAGHVILDPSVNRAWYSLILTAYAAQKDVNVFVSDGCKVVWEGTSYGIIGHMRSY